ncbi:NAD-dependent epimerase/dehydratase family protein [Shewanella litoralis]|nr:NAD-dependent epimerase/dehydratase family protein [Shewanella litoralis]
MILLTGATGFVGRAVLSQLTSKPHSDIRTFGRSSSFSLELNEVYGLEHLQGDINGTSDYTSALCGVDIVIHSAALAHVMHSNNKNCDSYRDINFHGAVNLAKQSINAGVKRFVFISSIAVNGSFTNFQPFTIDSSANPESDFSKSKYDAETEIINIAADSGLEVVIVRPTLVYGSNAPGNFGILTKLITKTPLLPFGLTNNKRDFIAVQNLADLLITCAKHPNAGGHTFLASDGETVSIKDFTNAIAKGLNKKLIQLPVPVSLMFLAARIVGKKAMAEQLLGNLQVDSSNAQEVLGWVPPFTMEQAMASLSENKK